jgi:RNA polymerase sigma-70 factor (ECF subfamily)
MTNTAATPRDRDLILAIQAGSLDALGEIYTRHRHLVYRTALVITGDTEAANDLLQDVFLRLFRFAGNIDPSRPIEPWLYRMTTNLSYDWVKQRSRLPRPLEDLIDWLALPGKNLPDAKVEQNDEWEQVQRAITSLPLPQRVVIVMYYLNDLSLQEIAEILEVPVGTVKSRLYYGRLRLRRKLGLDQDVLPDWYYDSP